MAGIESPSAAAAVLPYATNPMVHSIIFILVLDFAERFAFNGVAFTLPGYLTGAYDDTWNPGFTAPQMSSYMSMSQAIGYASPFLAAFLADACIGDYNTIVVFTVCCYIPGLFIISSLAIPGVFHLQEFPLNILMVGTHFLFPLGFGAAKTLYGVYAAKQFDQKTQTDDIKQFFVIYTAVEFLGSWLGANICITISHAGHLIVAQYLNAITLTLGIVVFLFGTKRYVNGSLNRAVYFRMFLSALDAITCFKWKSSRKNADGDKQKNKQNYDNNDRDPNDQIDQFLSDSHRPSPDGDIGLNNDDNNMLSSKDENFNKIKPKAKGSRKSSITLAAPGFNKSKISHGGYIEDSTVNGMVQLVWLFPIYSLLIPFNIAFTQVAVTAITQFTYTLNYGPFGGPMLVSSNFLFIGLWAVLIKRYITPLLKSRYDIVLTISQKFVLGSIFLSLGLVVMIIIMYQMKRVQNQAGEPISVFYGLVATFLVGGMAFSFAATNELAFIAVPMELKMLGTAVMLFMTQGLPNLFGALLYKRCTPWFQINGQSATTRDDYVNSDAVYFLFLLVGFTVFDVLLFSFPPLTRWMDEFEKTSMANNLRVEETANSNNNVSANDTAGDHNIDTISEEASI